MGQNSKTTEFEVSNLPFPNVPPAVLVGDERAVQNLLFLIGQTVSKQFETKFAELEKRLQGEPDLPLFADSKFWASKKGYAAGKTYTRKSFEDWARNNGHKKEANGFWSQAVGLKWLRG